MSKKEKFTFICCCLAIMLLSIANVVNNNTISELRASNARLSQIKLSLVDLFLTRLENEKNAIYALQAQLQADQSDWTQDWKVFQAKQSQFGDIPELAEELEHLNQRERELDAQEKECVAQSAALSTELSQLSNILREK